MLTSITSDQTSAWLPYVFSLLSVALGSAVTFLVSRAEGLRALDRQEAERRTAAVDKLVDLSADAYAQAVRALEWMGPLKLEDSADPQFADGMRSSRREAEARLEEARNLIERVAARADGDLAIEAGVVAGQLSFFYDQWSSAREQYERKCTGRDAQLFDRYWQNFLKARKALLGEEGGRWHRDVPTTSEPVVSPGSSLHAFKLAYQSYSLSVESAKSSSARRSRPVPA